MLPVHQHIEGKNEERREKIQRHHNIPLIDSVRKDPAHRRQKHNGQQRAGCHRTIQRGRTRFIQQRQRQRKTQRGIAEQRNNLADDDQRKIF